jgi:hypothetical protein
VPAQVSGAASDADARVVAKSVAGSSLAKAAIFGGDPNWGRIAAAAGYSGEGLTHMPSQLDPGCCGLITSVQDGARGRDSIPCLWGREGGGQEADSASAGQLLLTIQGHAVGET